MGIRQFLVYLSKFSYLTSVLKNMVTQQLYQNSFLIKLLFIASDPNLWKIFENVDLFNRLPEK